MLEPGTGSFYVVRIEAFADPTPPEITIDDLSRDLDAEIERLIERAQELSEAEMMDQVYRRLTLLLCWPCYRHWIEDPVGS
jgi:hypothetical protein